MVKKNVLITGIALLSLILVLSVSIILNNKDITGKAITDYNTPDKETCTSSEVSSLWASMFIEDATDIRIAVNKTQNCCVYFAYKNIENTSYVLYGNNCTGTGLDSGNLFYSLKQTYPSRPYLNDTVMQNIIKVPYLNVLIFLGELSIENSKNRTTQIITAEQADDEFLSILDIEGFELNDWVFDTEEKVYSFNKTEESPKAKGMVGVTSMYKDYTIFSYIISDTSSGCTPSWQQYNTSSLNGEKITISYNDSNNCGTTSGRPNSSVIYNDLDNNKVIGNSSSIKVEGLSIKVQADAQDFNYSANYTGTKEIRIKEENKTYVEFNWSFSNILNFDKINITKASLNNKNYLIINGIDINKTIFLDKSSNATGVCIKDSIIYSINQTSSDCSSQDEINLTCPGTKSGVQCSIEGSMFKIIGLMHSAIKEMNTSTIASSCIPLNCTDLLYECGTVLENACNTTINCGSCPSGETCNQGSCIISCSPDWECTSWAPEKCPKNSTQTRVCEDANECNNQAGRPGESKTCEYEGSKTMTIILIILGLIFLIGIIFLIIFLLKKRKANSQQTDYTAFPPVNQPKYPPTAPPQVNQNIPRPPINQNRPIQRRLVSNQPPLPIITPPSAENSQ